MAARYGISDYPEHLNPFNEDYYGNYRKSKRSNSFSDTLKGFRNTLRKSFRRGKHEKPQSTENSPVVLRKQAVAPAARYTLPSGYRNFEPSPALPRSRFKERLAKSGIHDEPLHTSTPKKEMPEEAQKRRKKRAPPPPLGNSIPEELDSKGLQVPQNTHSKWSLTSGETDTSYSTYTPSVHSEDNLELTETTNEIQEILQQITRDMEKLTDDSNNNNLSARNAESDIPDVVVSCVNDLNDNVSEEKATKETVADKIELFENINGDLKMIDDDDEEDKSSPVPKQRTHKLNKENLLGTKW